MISVIKSSGTCMLCHAHQEGNEPQELNNWTKCFLNNQSPHDGEGSCKNLTWGHKAPCRPGADGSSCSWRWRRERRTSCRSGSRCRAPTADPPLGYPESGYRQSRSRTDAYPARLAGSTSSRCSPGGRMVDRRKVYLVELVQGLKDKLVVRINKSDVNTP